MDNVLRHLSVRQTDSARSLTRAGYESLRNGGTGTREDRHQGRNEGSHTCIDTVSASLGITSDAALLLQQLPRNHHALYFTGPFTDGAQLHIAIKLFRRIVFDEAVAAVDLHAFIRAPHGNFAGEELRH